MEVDINNLKREGEEQQKIEGSRPIQFMKHFDTFWRIHKESTRELEIKKTTLLDLIWG